MLKDMNFDLIQTISIISSSLHRYDTYMKDAEVCASCKEIWLKLMEQREKELTMLLKELKAHIDSGKLSFD
jgi:hypothetical protein